MKLRTYAIAGLLALSATGCDSLLDTQPKQSLSPEVALGSLPLYRNLLSGAYNRLQSEAAYGQRLTLVPEALADNAVIAVNTGRYTTEVVSATGASVGGWATWYAIVNDANFIIASVDAVPNRADSDNALKAQIKAEALFLRGLAFFNLARIYSYEPGVGSFDEGIVLRTTPTRDPADAVSLPRSTRAETYAQIKSDLTDARTGFQAAFAADPTLARDVYFGSLAGTEALLSRVHLYAREWAQSEALATAALASAPNQNRFNGANRAGGAVLTTAATHPAAFTRQPNPESLFEVLIANTTTEGLGVNTALNAILVPGNLFYSVRASPELIATFEATDVRLQLFPIQTGTNRYTSKYSASLGNYADNIPVIRYAEVLLNRAEARFEQGNTGGALTDVNLVRTNRGIAALGAVSLDAILAERRRELAFEGHRFFDLKRRGLDIVKPAVTSAGTIGATDFRRLAPIPTDQVQLSQGLIKQNPGY